MVLAKIVTEAVKIGITHGTRFARYDKQAWNKLYTGFPKYVKKGTREGFIAGSSVGGLVKGLTSDDGTGIDNALPKKHVRKTYPKRKTRSGRRRFTNRYGGKCPPCNCRRKSYWPI